MTNTTFFETAVGDLYQLTCGLLVDFATFWISNAPRTSNIPYPDLLVSMLYVTCSTILGHTNGYLYIQWYRYYMMLWGLGMQCWYTLCFISADQVNVPYPQTQHVSHIPWHTPRPLSLDTCLIFLNTLQVPCPLTHSTSTIPWYMSNIPEHTTGTMSPDTLHVHYPLIHV